VNYERRHFRLKIVSNKITIVGTTAWIEKSLARVADFADYRVCFREIIEGVPAAYLNLSYVSVLDVVEFYGGAEWHGKGTDLGKVPETLLLDSSRIRVLNAFFLTDVLTAIVMMTAELKCRQVLGIGPVLLPCIANIQRIILENPPRPGAPEQIIEMVIHASATLLSLTHQASLRAILVKNVMPTSGVYSVMSKVMRNAWYHYARRENVPSHVGFPECARFLMPVIQKHASSLAKVVELNLKVHVERYNAIITATATTIVATRAQNERINAAVLEGDRAVENDGSEGSMGQ
jgi:hypothetical protein